MSPQQPAPDITAGFAFDNPLRLNAPQTINSKEHCTPSDVCVISPQRMLFQMQGTGFTDLSFRVLLRECSRNRQDARDEVRERIAGCFALGLMIMVPAYGMVSSSDISLVEESVAAETTTGTVALDPPPINFEAVLNRVETDQLTQADVRTVQTRLKLAGFDPGPIDGLAGKRTLSALNAYRQSLRLSPVLAVSRETIGALGDL
jgi:hypothetical protein